MRTPRSFALLLFMFVTCVLAASVQAQLPSTAPNVDPNVPCYRWPAVDFDGVDRCPGTAAGMEVDEYGCASNQRAASAVTPPPAERAREIEKPAPKPLPPAKPVSEAERQLVESGRIRLENIYFETNSTVLLPESEASLREAGEALEKFPDLRIEVEGHTDTRGSSAHNLRLSQGRAGTVRSWLLDHYTLRPDNLVAKGYGEERPETQERND